MQSRCRIWDFAYSLGRTIWNLNIKINEISKRRQNQKFGIINIDYLPENCNIVLNPDENNYEDGEIEQFFQ